MARTKPAPISLKKPRPKKAAAKPVQAFNMDAPEHKAKIVNKTVTKIVKDKALEARVAMLEGAEAPNVVVNLPPRPRIQAIAIKYDTFGQPMSLVPTYGE